MSATPTRKEVDRRVRDRLGPNATEKIVAAVVSRVMELLPLGESASPPQPASEEVHPASNEKRGACWQNSDRRIDILASGANRSGIRAAISRILADHQCDIRDISQTMDSDRFALNIRVDTSQGSTTTRDPQRALEPVRREFGIRILVKHPGTSRGTGA